MKKITRNTIMLLGVLLAGMAWTPPGMAQDAPGEADPFAEGKDPFAQFNEGKGDAPGGGMKPPALELAGFVEVEYAAHIGPDSPVGRDLVLENARLRLKSTLRNDNGGAYFKIDFLNDGVTGGADVDVREARVQYTPLGWLDLNLGRQVSTWGVGDMLFINDLFPKNWVAMFSGRDMEMWKDAAQAMRLAAYLGPLTWDVVYHPRFAPDTTPTGCRFAVYDPNQGAVTADPASCGAGGTPRLGGEDQGEVAMRLKTGIAGMELALYTYRGYYKAPRGLVWLDSTGTAVTGTPNPGAGDYLAPFHPRLKAYGLSLEGQAGPGILSLEAGYYDSLDDPDGQHFLVENSAWKYLLGYRMDLSAHFGFGMQWYMEDMQDYDAYEQAVLANNPGGYATRKAQRRNTYTLRLTVKAQQETLRINYFGYVRPEDGDSFHKLDFSKRLDNNYVLAGGINLFDGDPNRADREFSMVRDDDNAFMRLQYNF